MRFLGQQLSNINLLGLEISISTMSNFYLDPEQVSHSMLAGRGYLIFKHFIFVRRSLKAFQHMTVQIILIALT